MTNREIADQFSLFAKLMELHGENAFRTRTYQNAYNNLRRYPDPLSAMTTEQRSDVPAIGKSVGQKIDELLATGSIASLDALVEKTPSGIIEILSIRGLGPKKVRVIWDQLGVESPTELLYACIENRLIELKGFGLKSQADIADQINYYLSSRDKYLYAKIEDSLSACLSSLNQNQLGLFKLCGQAARKCPVIDEIKILYTGEGDIDPSKYNDIQWTGLNGPDTRLIFDEYLKCTLIRASETPVITYLQETVGSELWEERKHKIVTPLENISMGIAMIELNELPIECWDWPISRIGRLSDLVEEASIKGVVHSHSTYSDGAHTLAQMAQASRDKGYEYLVISDHSKAAFYANGLKEDRIMQQFEEIDRLNTVNSDFKIFKGIECDILIDGSMDYDMSMMKQFDVVIASIHTNLKMTEDKAMTRLIRAIEHPHTHILGHMTGRLLLARAGYPVDHRKIIDACSANGMAIELNANPYRLDMDYRWIDYAQEKGVYISINPDAHHVDGIDDIRYGVLAARKGGLVVSNCLNAHSGAAFMDLLSK